MQTSASLEGMTVRIKIPFPFKFARWVLKLCEAADLAACSVLGDFCPTSVAELGKHHHGSAHSSLFTQERFWS